MKHSGPIAWRDIVGEVSIHFCRSDWDLVCDLVLDMGLNPLSRCNVARASFAIREDFETYLNDVRDEPDHADSEARILEESCRTIAEYDEDDLIETRDLVEAKIRVWSLAECGVEAPA